MQKQAPEVFYKKLCRLSLLILNIAKFLKTPIMKNICQQPLLKMYSWNSAKLKNFDKGY